MGWTKYTPYFAKLTHMVWSKQIHKTNTIRFITKPLVFRLLNIELSIYVLNQGWRWSDYNEFYYWDPYITTYGNHLYLMLVAHLMLLLTLRLKNKVNILVCTLGNLVVQTQMWIWWGNWESVCVLSGRWWLRRHTQGKSPATSL